MQNLFINVPENYQYLSQWRDFINYLPEGHIILNKSICGCGCTDYFLTNGQPVILVSPRKRLIESKLKNGRTSGNLFYFDRSSGCELNETVKQLEKYLDQCGPNPFNGSITVPKIMVTYDSLVHVIEALINRGELDKFVIVVDEFTCIFTDVKLKGSTEINLLHRLNTLNNRIVYISATPLKDAYLDIMGEFIAMPYVTLEWDPSRIETVKVYYSKMRSISSAISGIILAYRANGYFKAKKIGDQALFSTEAVFFLNSVKDIASVIKKNDLKQSEVTVICADEAKNRQILNKVGVKIGTVPNEVEYQAQNKPFTFVTKCSFEGTDFYSDCSATYVFADCNRDNLSLDISIDLPQIAGRCRSRNNPFRNEIHYYYRNPDLEGQLDLKTLIQHYNNKRSDSLQQVAELRNVTHTGHCDRIIEAQKINQYSKDYVDVVRNDDGTWKAVCNDLAYISDIRAAEIKFMQYRNTYQMLCYLSNNGFIPTKQQNQLDTLFQQFIAEFEQDRDFGRRMKLIVDYNSCYPGMVDLFDQSSFIPYEFKEYYHELGTDRIQRCSYIEANLRKELNFVRKASSINIALEPDVIYSNAEIKSMIQAEYDRLGIMATAKATDIMRLKTNVARARYIDQNGKKQNGYKLNNN